MVTDEIKFIKTSREGVDLQHIQENYPNSIIDVNSDKERNIYIGSERVTDNYNPNVDENSITNNVGGIESGINVSELKGKSISEILDIILFSSNNNLELNGIDVVDNIVNLTDNTLKDVSVGKVVFVIEDGNIYVLKDIDFSDINNWEKQIPVLPNMEEYYTKLDVDNKLDDKQDILSAGSNVIIDNNEISVDLSNYALKTDIPNTDGFVSKGDLTEYAKTEDLTNYALKTDIPNTDGFALKEDLPNMEEYYTKLDVDNNFVSKGDLTNYAKTEDLKTEFGNYYTKTDIDNKLDDKQDILSAGSNVIIDNNEISVDLSNYALIENLPNMEDYYTKLDVDNNFVSKGEIENVALKSDLNIYALKTDIPNTDGFALKDDLTNYAKTEDLSNYALIENLPNMEEYVSKVEIENVALKSDLNIYALKTDIPNTDSFALKEDLPNMEEYYTKTDINNDFASKDDLNDYAKTSDIPDLTDYALKSELPEMNNYYTKDEVNNLINNIEELIGNAKLLTEEILR